MKTTQSKFIQRVAMVIFLLLLFGLDTVAACDIWNAYHGNGWRCLHFDELQLKNNSPYAGESPLTIYEDSVKTLHFYELHGETICILHEGRFEKNQNLQLWLKRADWMDSVVKKHFGISCVCYWAKHPIWDRVPLFLFSAFVFWIFGVALGTKKDHEASL